MQAWGARINDGCSWVWFGCYGSGLAAHGYGLDAMGMVLAAQRYGLDVMCMVWMPWVWFWLHTGMVCMSRV